MRRLLISFIVLDCLAGCAESTSLDEGQHIVGVVTSTSSATTPVQRPGPFTLVGAAGGLLGTRAAASVDGQMHIHNRLYVKTTAGEVVVDTDEYFAPGSCVEITPLIGEQSVAFFPYRSAQIVQSGKC
ncbi:MAG TPA: hypothetical protein VL199_13320 [Burkholderiales bacterium]|nr:hypothetical protein [Burkholderiales bacterium]